MRDRDPEQLNKKDDLVDVKELVRDAEPGPFTLDDILAEYGVKREPEPEAVPRRIESRSQPQRTEKDNVVLFPGARSAPVPELPQAAEKENAREPEEDREPESGEGAEDQEGEDEEPNDRVVEFPEEESVLSAFLKDVTRKADHYADHMFQESEEMDQEEIHRLEKLIPGTDVEEDEPEEFPGRFRRPRRPEPPPPDTAPQELARQYGKGLKVMRLRVVLVFLLAAAALFQLAVPAAGFVWLPPLDGYQVQVWIAAGLLGAGILLSLDVLAAGIARMFRGRVGMDTLAALSGIFTLADALVLAVTQDREGQLPYSAAVLAGLFFLLHGTYHKKCGLRLSCRTAASVSEPYILTLDEGKWNGRDTYCKWTGTPNGFGSQIQMDDGAQRIYRVVCPVLLLACVLLSLLASYGVGKPQHLLWCLSATFTAAAAFGGALVYGRPFHKVARRLAQSGGALAGWPGMAQSRKGDRVLITDGDLFPPGYVELNGIKVFGDWSIEKVVGCTATLIRDSGSGLTKLFHDLLRAQGAIFRRADDLCCYEGGGLSANIRGEQVLVGSAAFMNLMEVRLPQGLHVKNAVFCAIDGELAGIFALNYTLPDVVFPALDSLMREKVGPVLATRDFNLIPSMLHQRFKLAADKMDFPPVERRRELSDPDQPHSETITAVLCREGLLPYADAGGGGQAPAVVRPVRGGAHLRGFRPGTPAGLLPDGGGRLRLPVPTESVDFPAVLGGAGVVFDQLGAQILRLRPASAGAYDVSAGRCKTLRSIIWKGAPVYDPTCKSLRFGRHCGDLRGDSGR